LLPLLPGVAVISEPSVVLAVIAVAMLEASCTAVSAVQVVVPVWYANSAPVFDPQVPAVPVPVPSVLPEKVSPVGVRYKASGIELPPGPPVLAVSVTTPLAAAAVTRSVEVSALMAVAMLVATVVFNAGAGRAKLGPLVVPLEPLPLATVILDVSLVATVRAPAQLPESVILLLPLIYVAAATGLLVVTL
jgi:hypothetical protein